MNTTSPQLIDPFIPQKPRPIPSGQYGSQWIRRPQQTRSAPQSIQRHPFGKAVTHTSSKGAPHTISDFLPSNPISPSSPSRINEVSTEVAPTSNVPTKEIKHTNLKKSSDHAVVTNKRKSFGLRLLRKLQIPIFLIVAVIGGQLMTTLIFGEIAIGAYAIFAITRHVASSTTFLLAFITVVAITVLEASGRNSVLVTNFAVYVFLLLAVGTISLGMEVRERQF